MNPLSRRQAVKLGIGSLAAGGLPLGADEPLQVRSRAFLTPADEFEDVSRGNPKPHTLTGEALAKAGLTPGTWKLEVKADETTDAVVTQPARIGKSLTLDYDGLLALGREHRVLFLKAMQCLNIATPLGRVSGKACPCARSCAFAVRCRMCGGFVSGDSTTTTRPSVFNPRSATPR